MPFEASLIGLVIEALREINPEVPIKSEEIRVSVPEDPSHGDFSTNAALKLARFFGLPSMELGEKTVGVIRAKKPVFLDKVELVSPGFINLFLSHQAFEQELTDCLKAGGLKKEGAYGHNTMGEGKKVLVEFLSANPTGPLTIAHGRHAACGDTIANLLEASGYKVTREYYYNDRGRQMDILGRSLRLRYLQLLGEKKRMFKDGYQGKYLEEIARRFIEKYRKAYAREEKDLTPFRRFAERDIWKGIKKDLSDFRVRFNSWIKETDFYKKGKVKEVLEQLKKEGLAYEQEGAIWFKSTKYNDEKDRVLVKSNGEMTYLLPDMAYHAFKYERGYERFLTILGPDHHGYIGRLQAGVKALGYDDKKLTIKILQLVSLYRGKKKLRMSTRSGEFVTLRQVMDEVGVDATRFFLAMRGMDSHLDFDLELAKRESVENPVYYIQYAHARICSIFKFARENEVALKNILKINLGLLNRKEETELLKKLSLYPEVVKKGAELLETQGLTGYLLELASLFHQYYNKYRFITDDEELNQARLALAEAIRIVLSQGLKLLGVKAPKKM